MDEPLTTEQIKTIYVGTVPKFYSSLNEVRAAEFDRWLAEVKREVAARAWDEGYLAGLRDVTPHAPLGGPNPYRVADRNGGK